VLTLHDAEFTRLRVEDLGRRVRLSFTTDVERGAYDQPIEVVLEDFDYVFFSDTTEELDPPTVGNGGPVGLGPCRYGSIEAPEHGVDYRLRAGSINLTAIRARRIHTIAMPTAPTVSAMLTDEHAWITLQEAYISADRPASQRPRVAHQRVHAVELYPDDRQVALQFEVPLDGHPSWLVRAKYEGAARIELEAVKSDLRGSHPRAWLRPHAGSDRLSLGAAGMYVQIAGSGWQRRDLWAS
jgi:hypothetical protein